jgi:hypothetical protein
MLPTWAFRFYSAHTIPPIIQLRSVLSGRLAELPVLPRIFSNRLKSDVLDWRRPSWTAAWATIILSLPYSWRRKHAGYPARPLGGTGGREIGAAVQIWIRSRRLESSQRFGDRGFRLYENRSPRCISTIASESGHRLKLNPSVSAPGSGTSVFGE